MRLWKPPYRSSEVDLVLTAAIFRDLAADHDGASAAARACA